MLVGTGVGSGSVEEGAMGVKWDGGEMGFWIGLWVERTGGVQLRVLCKDR